ncbi:MAG: (d)CMP kinase [Clostridia bacterium]|nr:(d)CMP kinase [Clostridia bacterium]
MSFVVAIDGPAGSGKGTITKLVGEKLDLVNIDTGAMYRCVALETLNRGIKVEETDKIVSILDEINIEFKNTEEGKKVYLNGNDVTTKIRSKEVSTIVSPVSSIKAVRYKMVDLQRRMAEGKNVIMEGRDIGTYVFPNANVKIYLDATAEERATRRFKQNQEAGIEMSYEEILQNIKARDKIDMEKEMGALKQAEDAIYIDSSDLTIEQVKDKIVEIIKSRI